jgi:hypothetical protein
MEFPADLIPLVVSFLDPPSLATMAQTCRAWKTIIYRTSVWKPYLWKPHLPYIHLFRVQKESRHLGEPHALCFLAWLHQLSVFESFLLPLASTPLTLTQIQDDAKRRVRRAYREWCSKKKPCVHIAHHEWSSVFVLPLTARTPSERLEIQSQVCDEWSVCKLTLETPYSDWLTGQLNLYARYSLDTLLYPTEPLPGTPLTVLQSLRAERQEQLLAFKAELAKLGDRIHYRIQKSHRRIRLSHTPREFDANERRVRDERLWDAAAFTLATAKTNTKTATHKRTPPSDEPESSTRPA